MSELAFGACATIGFGVFMLLGALVLQWGGA
jgi:hypothetical protein